MDQLILSDFFTTKPQAADFSDRLSAISSQLYKVDLDLESLLQKNLGVQKKDKFLSLLRENNIPVDSNQALNEFIDEIKETMKALPEATISLAIEPDDQLLKSISDWFILHIKKQVLIDIEIAPEIVGGAVIRYQGKRFDGSISSMFQKISDNNMSSLDEKSPDRSPHNQTTKHAANNK